MNETDPTGTPPPRRLVRSSDDKLIGGVCGGLGGYFEVDPVFFRIGAIVLTLVAGVGVLLYIAALLLVPSGDNVAPISTEGRNRGLVIAGVVVLLLVSWPFLVGGGFLLAGVVVPLAFLVAAGVLVWWLVSGDGPSGEPRQIAKRAALGVGVLIGCFLLAVAGAWAAAAGGEAVVAGLVIGAGVAVLAGAFLKPVRWLILPAIALALSAGVVSAAGIDLDGGIGERDYRPASVLDLEDRYELGMGRMVIDLRDTELPAGDTALEVDLGVGEAMVFVPEDVCVATRADIGAGEVLFFNRRSDGVDVDFVDERGAAPDVKRLVIDADIGVGSFRVGQPDESVTYDRAGFRFEDHWNEPLGLNDACLVSGER